MSTDQLLERATERHFAGDLTAARRLYEQVLADSSDHAVARFRMGLLEMQEGHPEAALILVEQAIVAAPDEPRVSVRTR